MNSSQGTSVDFYFWLQDNTFEWSNNWYPTYTNWKSTEGSDMEYLRCFAMDNGINGGWYELNCTTPLAGICKTTVGELHRHILF